MLAADKVEGIRVFTDYAQQMGREKAFDEVIVPALQWTRRERKREDISPEEENFILKATQDAIAVDVVANSADWKSKQRLSRPKSRCIGV